MVACSPCFAFYCFSSCYWFIQTSGIINLISLGPPLWPYSNLIVSHVFSITFLLTTNNLMLYVLHSRFVSSQNFLNPLSLLGAYPLQAVG